MKGLIEALQIFAIYDKEEEASMRTDDELIADLRDLKDKGVNVELIDADTPLLTPTTFFYTKGVSMQIHRDMTREWISALIDAQYEHFRKAEDRAKDIQFTARLIKELQFNK